MARIHEGALEALSTRPDIISMLATFKPDFDITWASPMKLYGAQVYAILLRPEKHIKNGFGLENEILLLHHQYSTVQPRILHIAEKILSESPCMGRAEPMAFMLLTASTDAKAQVRSLSADSNNPRVIVPFEEVECRKINDEYFVRNRLAEFFYSRDLFDMSRPLASDLYFFGRHSFVLSLRDLLKSGENLGLFGLRRTGKTSVLFRLQRLLEEGGAGKLIYFDLEDSAFYQLRWWELLDRIGASLPGGKKAGAYTEANAAELFRIALSRVSKATKIVVALDEIEHITPGERLRMRPHWDSDFVEFWKTVRAVQNTNRHVSFVVCGTNAAPVETASFSDRDNPLFGMVTKKYMPPFSRDEVRQMTRTLGRFMGLSFSEDCFDYLHERYGGHPHLTRQACSRIFDGLKDKRKPIEVTKVALQSQEADRDLALFSNAENVLSVLQRWYPLEYEMLDYLARNDLEAFQSVERSIPDLSAHLRAYGLVRGNPPELAMQFIASFLRSRVKDLVSAQSAPSAEPTDQEGELFANLAKLGFHRNRLEIKLRRFIKRVLVAMKGPQRWIDVVLQAVSAERREKLAGIDRDEILREHLFLIDLLNVVMKGWVNFAHLEQQTMQTRVTKVQFEVILDFMNKHREDAHAKDVSEATLAAVGIASQTIEAAIDPYLED